eukprot:comp20719_c0_seq1/m.27063 comp20719_c0_seq1/g.27063  ORF comp20719_c0_seq1/g.27063 comp20719_c0_seq1/m.27063 type:complete len:110 (+) comp20719_c0_seq1:314-643(+)
MCACTCVHMHLSVVCVRVYGLVLSAYGYVSVFARLPIYIIYMEGFTKTFPYTHITCYEKPEERKSESSIDTPTPIPDCEFAPIPANVPSPFAPPPIAESEKKSQDAATF